MYLSIKGTINIVASTLPINHPPKVTVKSVHGMTSLNARDNEPHKAPIKLLRRQAKTRNIAISFFVRKRMFTLKYEKAKRGIITCHRSARDQITFNKKGISARIPAPIIHPIYAGIAPHIPYQSAKTIINETAKYKLETPDASGIGDFTTANLDKREFTNMKKRNMLKCPDNDSISLIFSSPY